MNRIRCRVYNMCCTDEVRMAPTFRMKNAQNLLVSCDLFFWLNVEMKTFFSILLSWLTRFVTSNGYINSIVQKAGIWDYSSCIEHATLIWFQRSQPGKQIRTASALAARGPSALLLDLVGELQLASDLEQLVFPDEILVTILRSDIVRWSLPLKSVILFSLEYRLRTEYACNAIRNSIRWHTLPCRTLVPTDVWTCGTRWHM